MSGAIDTCVSNRPSLVFLAITLLSFLAASSVPTPLYPVSYTHLRAHET